MNDTTKSVFVTVVAWIFIVITGFTTLISILQNIMLQMMFNQEEIEVAMANQPENTPAIFTFMSQNMEFFFMGFLVVSVFAFIASIGLLRRKNWARIAFIGLMVIGVVWNLGSMILQEIIYGSMSEVNQANFMDDQMNTMINVMMIAGYIFNLIFTALFGWIAYKLMSKPIRDEFLLNEEAIGQNT